MFTNPPFRGGRYGWTRANAGLGSRVFRTATYLETAKSFTALTVRVGLGLPFHLVPAALQRVLRAADG